MEPNDIVRKIAELAEELNRKATTENQILTASNVLMVCGTHFAGTAREMSDLLEPFMKAQKDRIIALQRTK